MSPIARHGHEPTIGVVGGGQLARMMYQAAIPLAIELRVLAAGSGDSAARIARHVTVGDWHDPEVLRSFAAGCDVVTFDHELVEPATVSVLEEAGATVRPGSSTLRLAADKAELRRLCGSLGIPTPEHVIASGPGELTRAAQEVGYPVMAKLARGGYDGRGVFRLDGAHDARDLAEVLPGDAVLVVEPVIDLVAELATQVVRRADGATVHYPLVRTCQQAGICRWVEAPADVDPSLAAQARAWSTTIAEATEAVGILAVELFLTDRGLVLNELAPRPHNTGHYTIDACVTSQFENHLRAVVDLPFGATDLVVPAAVMVNLLSGGADDPTLGQLTADADARVHLYGKEGRPGRKVGHVTLCGDDARALTRRLSTLTGTEAPPPFSPAGPPGTTGGRLVGSAPGAPP